MTDTNIIGKINESSEAAGDVARPAELVSSLPSDGEHLEQTLVLASAAVHGILTAGFSITSSAQTRLQKILCAHPRAASWFVVVACGVAVGLMRGIIGWLIQLGFDLRLWAMLLPGNNLGLVFLAVCLCAGPLALLAAFLVVYVAPAASGGGVADIKATLNGIEAPAQLFSIRAFIVRFLTIPLASASGMIIGFEAPMTHLGALVTVLFTEQLTGSRPHGKHLTDLVSMGTAMGSCAAFITPLCGFLMVREELSLHWDNSLAIKTLVGCFSAALVSRFMRGLTTCGWGDVGCLGVGGVIRFNSSDAFIMFTGRELLTVIIIGVLGGFLGAGISVVTWYRGQVVKNRSTSKPMKVIWAGFAVVLVCSCYMLIAAVDGCVPLPADHGSQLLAGTSGLAKSVCPTSGHYNPGALILFEPRYPAVKSLFQNQQGPSEMPASVLLASTISIFASMALVLSMQVPFGLVFPHILMGACLGRLVGLLLSVQPGVAALLGVAASLAGLRRTVVPITVLVIELTGNVTNILPVVAATLIAKWVADSLYMRQFDVVIKLKGYPVMSNLTERMQKVLSKVRVKDMMSAPAVTVKVGESAESVKATLASNGYGLFPVLSNEGRVLGIMFRDELIRLIQNSDALDLTDATLEDPLFINLHAWFTGTYKTFRNLGLRCMLVLDNDGRLAGVVTRTSFVKVMNDPDSFMNQ